MLACVLGVILILYWGAVVVTGIGVVRVIEGVSVAGFATDPYTVLPASSVISTKLRPPDVPAASVTVTAVTESVPALVANVKASAIVADPPGGRGSGRWRRSPPSAASRSAARRWKTWTGCELTAAEV